MTTKTTAKTTTKKTTKKSTKASTLPSLPNNPLVFEIFDLVSRQRSKAKKIEVLKKYEDLRKL